jgi:hypothetical protein
MNKLEQDTLEIIQEFLPRIAVALEKIATQNNGEKQCTSKSQKPTA